MGQPTHHATRYKYDLTPRQEEILRMMARGRTNAEIAEAYGMSLDGAKYHVREILAKLGVESREEAVAAWSAGRGRSAIGRAVRWGGAIFASKLGAAAVGGVAVVAVSAIAAAALILGGGEGTPAVPLEDATAPAPAPTATPVPPPTVVPVTCVDDDFVPMSLVSRTDLGVVEVEVLVDLFRPCQLPGDLVVALTDRSNGALPVTPASYSLATSPAFLGRHTLAVARWSNWCGEPGQATVKMTILSKTLSDFIDAPPLCEQPATSSALVIVPPPDRSAVRECEPGEVALRIERRRAGDTNEYTVRGEPRGGQCLFSEILSANLVQRDGTPVAFMNLSTGAYAPGDELAAFMWGNWCGEPGDFELSVTADGSGPTLVEAEPPACVDAAFPTRIAPLATAAGIRGARSRPPLPAGLEAVEGYGNLVEVWLYAGSDATPGRSCDDLVADMVPVSAALAASAVRSSCAPGNARLTFARDADGVFYLRGVGLLPLALATLPQPSFDPDCANLKEYMVPAAEPAATAAYVFVCDIEPRPRGAPPGRPVLIWVRIVKSLAPDPLPDGVPCWQTSRYLGPAGERETVEVRCVLE